MNIAIPPPRSIVIAAAARREWLSHRLNRFLYAHIGIVALAGLLPLFTPGDVLARGAAWWLLHAVLYAVSLSSVLLGLSSAQADAEEYPWLQAQPAGIGPWLAGKTGALVGLAGGSTLLLGAPVALAGGYSHELLLATAGAAGVATACALAGLAIGFWIRDAVRSLIAAVGAWLLLVFGTDLLLLALAGVPIAQARPDLWVGMLMANPLDAYRLAILFAVERAAFSGMDAGALASWWSTHAFRWLVTNIVLWTLALGALAWLGARRRVDA